MSFSYQLATPHQSQPQGYCPHCRQRTSWQGGYDKVAFFCTQCHLQTTALSNLPTCKVCGMQAGTMQNEYGDGHMSQVGQYCRYCKNKFDERDLHGQGGSSTPLQTQRQVGFFSQDGYRTNYQCPRCGPRANTYVSREMGVETIKCGQCRRPVPLPHGAPSSQQQSSQQSSSSLGAFFQEPTVYHDFDSRVQQVQQQQQNVHGRQHFPKHTLMQPPLAQRGIQAILSQGGGDDDGMGAMYPEEWQQQQHQRARLQQPGRCPKCHGQMTSLQSGGGHGLYEIICTQCQYQTQAPHMAPPPPPPPPPRHQQQKTTQSYSRQGGAFDVMRMFEPGSPDQQNGPMQHAMKDDDHIGDRDDNIMGW